MPNKKLTIVLLPGLNGTSGLFEVFIDNAPNIFELLPITFPTDQFYSYEDLSTYVIEQLEAVNGPFILVGESFSGPLSVLVSKQHPNGLIGTILVASFIHAPYSELLHFLPWRLIFTLLKPLYGAKFLCKHSSLTYKIATELQKVAPKVLAQRIQAIFSVNLSDELRACKIPFIYFRGKYDFMVPNKNAKKIIDIKPDTKVIIFKTHHFLLQSAPEKAWQETILFVEELIKN